MDEIARLEGESEETTFQTLLKINQVRAQYILRYGDEQLIANLLGVPVNDIYRYRAIAENAAYTSD